MTPASAPAASAAVGMDEPPHLQEASPHPFNARTTGFNIPVQPERAASGSRSAPNALDQCRGNHSVYAVHM